LMPDLATNARFLEQGLLSKAVADRISWKA